MPSTIVRHRFERVPSRIPARRPAPETSWQGVPPSMISTGSTLYQSIWVMSPRLGTSGQRCASTFAADCFGFGAFSDGGSYSECHTTRPPNAARTASVSPP